MELCTSLINDTYHIYVFLACSKQHLAYGFLLAINSDFTRRQVLATEPYHSRISSRVACIYSMGHTVTSQLACHHTTATSVYILLVYCCSNIQIVKVTCTKHILCCFLRHYYRLHYCRKPQDLAVCTHTVKKCINLIILFKMQPTS